MKIIKLHSTLGTEVYINTERIDLFYQSNGKTALLIGGSDEPSYVSESADEILKMIEEVDTDEPSKTM